MTEFLDGKNKNTIRMLWIGLVILALCLGTCIFLVSVLRSTYATEISQDFQAHHESARNVIDSMLKNVIDVTGEVVDEFETAETFPASNRVFEILDLYNNLDGVTTIAYLTNLDKLYYRGSVMPKNQAEGSTPWAAIESRFINTKGSISITYLSNDFGLGDGEKMYLLVERPIYYKDTFKGYILATVDITSFFDNEAFDYQNEIGECYLVDSEGEIVISSKEAQILKEGSNNLFTSILAYSNGKEKSKIEIQKLRTYIGKKETNFVSLTTRRGHSLQVSIAPLKDIPNIFFVSCFNDNIVDDKVQPLIFRSVLSCIVIIFLMIIVILYVWATAKRANITIERLAYIDPVTDGKNINFFKEFSLNTMSVYKETPFVIYRFDIANFRYINEAYGHTRADGILKVCISSFEEVFSDKELCVRMNADQFLALIVNDKTIGQKMKQFTDKVNENTRGLGVKYPIKFKVGVCQVKKHASDIDVFIDHANVARKTLKGDEKESLAYYSEKIVNDMRKVDRIESEQQRALATEEFKVFLQPKWNINENRIAGAEALVRWIKADGSMVYPDEFIPVFENNGFVEKLDFYMLEKVCTDMRELIEAGRPVYPVSVNQSRLLLHSTDYVKNVEKIIRQNNIPAGYIELEITETVFENERDTMIRIMNELKKIGVKLAMDDFGSGYSSLNMLKDVPFDIIKIDREFFSESVTSEASLWILQKIVEMADGIGMEVICEGVETGEQVVILKSIGCNRVQGYYYSKPVSSDIYYNTYCVNRVE